MEAQKDGKYLEGLLYATMTDGLCVDGNEKCYHDGWIVCGGQTFFHWFSVHPQSIHHNF
jgi:hypothetical protein